MIRRFCAGEDSMLARVVCRLMFCRSAQDFWKHDIVTRSYA
jgi:hypothetical protein